MFYPHGHIRLRSEASRAMTSVSSEVMHHGRDSWKVKCPEYGWSFDHQVVRTDGSTLCVYETLLLIEGSFSVRNRTTLSFIRNTAGSR